MVVVGSELKKERRKTGWDELLTLLVRYFTGLVGVSCPLIIIYISFASSSFSFFSFKKKIVAYNLLMLKGLIWSLDGFNHKVFFLFTLNGEHNPNVTIHHFK